LDRTLFVDTLASKLTLTTADITRLRFNIPGSIRYTMNQPCTFGTQVNHKL